MSMMERYYNGYQFVFPPDTGEMMYNATMVLYFLEYLQKHCRYPRDLLDSNLSPDRNKIEYVASIPGGEKVVLQLTRYRQGLTEIYGDILRLHEHVVIAVGFERLVWVMINRSTNC
jgi:hypothetical protein